MTYCDPVQRYSKAEYLIWPNPNASLCFTLNHCPGFVWEPVSGKAWDFRWVLLRKEGSMLMAKGKMGERVSEDAQLKLNDLVVDYGYKAWPRRERLWPWWSGNPVSRLGVERGENLNGSEEFETQKPSKTTKMTEFPTLPHKWRLRLYLWPALLNFSMIFFLLLQDLSLEAPLCLLYHNSFNFQSTCACNGV